MAKKLIFLDFEGFENKHPSLVGFLNKGEFNQIILDKAFRAISDATDIDFLEFKVFCNFISQICLNENAFIASYSSLEQKVITEELQRDIPFIDLRIQIKKMVNRNHSEEHKTMKEYWAGQRYLRNGNLNPHHNPYNKKRWKLLTILKLFDYPEINTSYGDRKVTKRLRDVLSGLKARGSYEMLTPVQKSKWTKLLKHNYVDVMGLDYLLQKLDIEI